MVARNEHTGDKIQTKETSEAYRDGWDAIFGKFEELGIANQIKQTQEKIAFNTCCGKCSPCSGHSTQEEESSKPS